MMTTTTTVSKRLFVAVSGACLVLAGSGCSVKAGDFSEMKKRLEDKDVAVVVVVRKDAEVHVLTPEGNPVEPCATREGTKRIPNMNIKDAALRCGGEIKDKTSTYKTRPYTHTINLSVKSKNPNCIEVETYNHVYELHAGGDGFPASAFPCHAGQH